MKLSKTSTKNKSGFTLIELLVVIAIIGILSSVVLASLSGARESARDAQRRQHIDQIQTALEMYRNDNNGNLPFDDIDEWYVTTNNSEWSSLASELDSYISPLPKDPVNNPNSSSQPLYYAYRSQGTADGEDDACDLESDEGYVLTFRLESSSPDLPVWNSSQNAYCVVN